MEITVLCKVVDNYGDVGVTWRMVNQLKRKYPSENFNYVIDDLDSFNKICHDVDVSKSMQNINSINIYNSNDYELCYKSFLKDDGEKLSVILE